MTSKDRRGEDVAHEQDAVGFTIGSDELHDNIMGGAVCVGMPLSVLVYLGGKEVAFNCQPSQLGSLVHWLALDALLTMIAVL